MLTVIFKVSLLFQYEIGVTMAYTAQSARCLTSFYCTFCSLEVFMLTGTGVSGCENPGKLSTDETLTTCFTWLKIYGRTKFISYILRFSHQILLCEKAFRILL